MAKTITARVQMKRDTASNWEKNNPQLLKGEICIVETASGEVRGKVGDGVKTYTQLPFSDEIVRNLINTTNGTISTHTGDNNIHITTSERQTWNNKANKDVATINTNGLMSSSDKQKLNSIGRIYSGTTAPSNALGQDGDLYIVLKSTNYQTQLDNLEAWKAQVLAGQTNVVVE